MICNFLPIAGAKKWLFVNYRNRDYILTLIVAQTDC